MYLIYTCFIKLYIIWKINAINVWEYLKYIHPQQFWRCLCNFLYISLLLCGTYNRNTVKVKDHLQFYTIIYS